VYYYDENGQLVMDTGMMPAVGYPVGIPIPVGAPATVVDRRSGSTSGTLIGTRPRPTITRTPRRQTGGTVTVTPGGSGYVRDPVTGALMRARPGAIPVAPAADMHILPYFGDDPAEQQLIERLRVAEATLQEAQRKAEIEQQIRDLNERKVEVGLYGTHGLSGSAASLVHGSSIYPTEIPLKADAVAASGSTFIRYTTGRAIRIYRFLALNAETKDNFTITAFKNNDRDMREAYSAGGGVDASYFTQDDEKLVVSFPWIGENRRFDVFITNNDAVNPHNARFLVCALESEVAPEQFDRATAAKVDQFLNRLVMA